MLVNGRSRATGSREPDGSTRAGGQGREALAVPAVEAEPLARLRGDDERAVRQPARLGRPGRGIAGDDAAGARHAVGVEPGDDALRPVPGQVRVVPAEPGQAGPVGRETRRGEEVAPLDERAHGAPVGRGAPVEGDRDDRVGALPRPGVVLADGQEARPARVEREVGVAEGSLRRERRRRSVGSHEQEPAGREVGDDEEAAGGEVGPAAVLVDARPDVHPRRADVLRRAPRPQADERRPAAVLGPALEPEQVVAVPARLGEPDEAGHERLGRDRGAPAAVGRDRSSVGSVRRHRRFAPAYVPVCQDAM